MTEKAYQARRPRKRLVADRTYYYRTDGSNSNSGLADSAAGAFLTAQKAVDVAAELDFNGHVVTIQHGVESGVKTFTAGVIVPQLTGGGRLAFKGSSTPGNTIFSVTGADCFLLNNTITEVSFQDIEMNTGSSGLIQVVNKSNLILNSGVIFGSANNAQIYLHDRQAIATIVGTTLTVKGTSNYFIEAVGGWCFLEACTVTLSSTPVYVAFVFALSGHIQAPSNTFTGSATGSRYLAQQNGVVNSTGGGASYFPGSTVGAVSSGGQYL